jgi:multicomponent Na+:H+ antiporter subunit A
MLVPPAILGALVVAISLQPNLFISGLVGEVYGSVVPGEAHSFSVAFPTKLTPYVLMSVITIAVGAVSFPFYDRIHDAINAALRGPVRANWWYDNGVEGLDALSATLTPRVQTGLLRTYATWAFAGVAALTLGGYAATTPGLPGLVPDLTVALVLVLAVAVVAAVAILAVPSHIAGVLTLSIVGFMIAIFYILANAPDLALTQLVIETLVLVIFLLVLDRLPAYYGAIERRVAVRDTVVATAVGVTVFLTVLLSTSASPDESLPRFLTERAGVPAEHGPFFTDYGGGGNIVNVILVDFRAFDTLGEISVVAMAALAVLTLVRMRTRGETR